MNILLCMPKTYFTLHGGWFAPPMGITQISSYLKKMGYSVYTLNFILEDRPVDEVMEEAVIRHDIDAVGCGGLIVNYELVKEIIDVAKEIKPELHTFIGGGMVTYSPLDIMTLIPNADYGVMWEGELTACALLEALEQGTPLREVAGIVRRTGKKVVINPLREEQPNLDTLPFPDYDGFHLDKLISNNSASVVTSRSCPFSCTFCTHSGGNRYRQRSLDSILTECRWLIDRFGVTSFYFTDELFAVNRERIFQFCDLIEELGLEWFVSLRISDEVTPDLLRRMKQSGCSTIFYGLESACQEILDSMNKRTTVSQMERVLQYTVDAGIEARGGFIFGDVAETADTARVTLNWTREHTRPKMVFAFIPIIAYPGSPLYDQCVKDGKISPLEHIRAGCPPLNLSKMTDEEYNLLVNTTLPREYALSLTEREMFLDFDDLGCTKDSPVRWECPHCGHTNHDTVDLTKMYVIEAMRFGCESCKKVRSMILVYSYVHRIRQRWSDMLKDGGSVLWGIGHFYKYLFQFFLPHDKEMQVILCDGSTQKQNTQVFGYLIHPPTVLNNPGIQRCIITTEFYDSIRSEINTLYPHISAIPFHEVGALMEKGAL